LTILPAISGFNVTNDSNSGSGFASTKSTAKAATSKKITKRIFSVDFSEIPFFFKEFNFLIELWVESDPVFIWNYYQNGQEID
jgi:hypothetical protein